MAAGRGPAGAHRSDAFSHSITNRPQMHDPQRDPFFEGLWADVQEGIDAANAGDLVDGEEFFAELLGEPLPVVES